MNRKSICALLVLCLLGAVNSSLAQWKTPTLGDPGGTPFEYHCGGSMGSMPVWFLWVASGASIDRVSAACWDYSASPWYGGSGGTVRSNIQCPSQQALRGIEGYHSWYVNGLRASCRNWDNSRETLTAWVGAKSGEYNNLRCANGYIVTGIRGESSNLVDRLTVYCGPWGP